MLFQGRIWINKGNSFIPLLLEEFHKSPLGGHMGKAKTLSRLKTNFYWASMTRDTHNFVLACPDCQHTKYVTLKPASVMQPLPVPSRPWEDLALDFITGLPNYKGYTVILVVVDRFSKGGHFGLLKHPFTAFQTAQLFLDMVCKLHGFPKSLVSDRDPIFVSHFWQDLFKLSRPCWNIFH